jgi:hypothetical protein
MWLLTTRNRPGMAQRTLDACEATGMSTPGIAFLDGCHYPGFRLPQNWIMFRSAENVGVGAAMQWFLRHLPNVPFYGWLADDFVPQTPFWDRRLIEAAGDRFMAFGNDLYPRDFVPQHLTSAFAIGGELVRAVGWFSPPGLRQAGIDSAWNQIGRRFGLMRYLHDVVVAHEHYSVGKRPKDATDNDMAAEQPLWDAYRNGPHQKAAMAAVEALLKRAA